MNGQYYNYTRRPMGPGPGRPPMNNQGGFLGPFILGGITGGLISPLFWNNNRHSVIIFLSFMIHFLNKHHSWFHNITVV